MIFNIYRKTNNEGFQFYDIAKDIEYLDTNTILEDHYCHIVTMVWTNNDDTCESAQDWMACETLWLGTDEPEQNETIKIFPNPAKNWLNIESEEEIQKVRLYNLLGEMILQEEVNQSAYRLDINGIQDGIYYVTVEMEKRDFKAKIVILR